MGKGKLTVFHFSAVYIRFNRWKVVKQSAAYVMTLAHFYQCGNFTPPPRLDSSNIAVSEKWKGSLTQSSSDGTDLYRQNRAP